ncbi:uncharacterized protein RCC_08309 [Ramularia collo-cygni]|uniref:Small secreted protein n=1 Tax=Ramularia collo-cygni TaxID=112498 RepID=A0A2D3VJZ0_9PEZI|nr:uncharacterized protein RCC_08309 [Ramularia collo-cygni]CZT22439.1 uncharacterized protein RCC_08309 [Ramularia collo-cygni]
MLKTLRLLLITITTLFLPSVHSQNPSPPALNITAITATNGASILECWRLDNFTVSTVPGTVGALSVFFGQASNVSYTVIPPRTNAGLHRAPTAQFVTFLSGLIHVTLPNSTDDAWIIGGKYGLIFAEDTADVSEYGHGTEYPAKGDTIALEVPLAPGTKLNHTVLHAGGCMWEDQTGL